MALIAFDGTWQADEEQEAQDSNVIRFANAYDSDNVLYVEGIGTRLGRIGRIFGGLTGAGGRRRTREAFEALEEFRDQGDDQIDVIGFSRGGALALHFANMVEEKLGSPIRFLGLWDAVASFGMPGNEINFGYDLRLGRTVQKCFHALALDERRQNFPVIRVQGKSDAHPANEGRLAELWFRGVHSDVGGGNGKTGLCSITLHWMLLRARECGLPIAGDALLSVAAGQQPDEELFRSKDPLPDPFRTIHPTDVVHESVSYRAGADYNNPPEGVHIAGDDGRFLAERFRWREVEREV